MGAKISLNEKIDRINKEGKIQAPSYEFVSFGELNEKSEISVTVKCLDGSGRTATKLYRQLVNAKQNPFVFQKLSNSIVKDRVNKIGSESNPPYCFVKSRTKIVNKKNVIVVTIKNLENKNKKTEEVNYRSLLNDANPWRLRRIGFSKEEIIIKCNERGLTHSPTFFVLEVLDSRDKFKHKQVRIKSNDGRENLLSWILTK